MRSYQDAVVAGDGPRLRHAGDHPRATQPSGRNWARVAIVLLGVLVTTPGAHSAERAANLPDACQGLLEQALALTEEAYRREGLSAAAAQREARLMEADMFFFWPPEYFYVEPRINDPSFISLRDRMNALWDRSRAGNCGIAFHPVPVS